MRLTSSHAPSECERTSAFPPAVYRATHGARAGEGNRTPITSLEGWGSTVELHPHSSSSGLASFAVGARGFEPPTPCSQSRCATRLRHAPPRPGMSIANSQSARRFAPCQHTRANALACQPAASLRSTARQHFSKSSRSVATRLAPDYRCWRFVVRGWARSEWEKLMS